MSEPVIAPLASEADAAVVAEWIWTEWARHEPGVDRARSDAGVYGALHGARMPYFVVARVADMPVGCASIVAADLPPRSDLGPWLANVFVQPAWRDRGLGTALVERAMAHGATLADALYLYASGSTALYERLGWRFFDAGHYAGQRIAILRHDLGRSATARR